VRALARRPGLACLLVSAGLVVARPARGADPDGGSFRVTVGWSFGRAPGSFGQQSEAAGWPKQSSGGRLRCERRMLDRLWLGMELSGAYWLGGSDAEAGYHRAQVDLGLVPRLLIVPAHLPAQPVGLYMVAPFGLSGPFIEPPPRRAFQERVHGRLGWYAGALGGAEVLLTGRARRVFTLAVEGGYRLHVTGERTTFTVDGTMMREDRRLVDHEISLSFAAGVVF
jgi:hypothetical protein